VNSGFVDKAKAIEETVVTEEELNVVVPPSGAAKAMTEVKVTSEDTMVAMFDGVVPAEATFEVTGAMTVKPTVTWNEAKTEATIKSAGVFLDGSYTIKVTAEGIEADKATATVVVSKNGIAKIEIIGDKLVRTENNLAEVTMKLFDTYGNDVTEKMSYDVTLSTSYGVATIKDSKKGIIEISTASATPTTWSDFPATPQLVTLTIYSKTVAGNAIATTTKTLTVTAESKVDKVTLSEVVLPSGYTKLTLGKAEAGYIIITAKDQFDREITDKRRLDIANEGVTTGLNRGQVFYTVSDSTIKTPMTVVEETNDKGDKEFRLKINLTGLDSTNNVRKVTVQAISQGTGSVSNAVTLDLRLSKQPARVTLGAPASVVAVGDTFDDTIVIPVMAYDEDGALLSADEVADKQNQFTISGSLKDNLNLIIATSGVNKGKIVGRLSSAQLAEGVPAAAKGSNSVTVQINGATTVPATMQVEVREKAAPRSIEFRQVPSTNLMFTSTAKFSYDFIDQYGRKMDDTMLNTTNLKNHSDTANRYRTALRLTMSNVTKATGKLYPAGANTTILTDGSNIVSDLSSVITDDTLSVTALQSAGSVSLKAELLKYEILANGTDVDATPDGIVATLDRSFSVADGVPANLTYEIVTIPEIRAFTEGAGATFEFNTAADYDGDGTVWATDATQDRVARADALIAAGNYYAKKLKITAKDANGNSFEVPSSRVLDVKSADETIAFAKLQGTDVKVIGLGSAFPVGETATTKDVNVTVKIGTDTEVKTLTAKVTVAKEAAKVQSIMFIDKPLVANPYDELPSSYKEVKEVTINDNSVFYIVTKDQYDVYRQLSGTVPLTVSNKDKAGFTTLNYLPANKLQQNIAAADVRKNSTIVLMYSADNAANTINMRVGTAGVDDPTVLTSTLDTTVPTAPTAVTLTPVGGNIVANTINTTNTNLTATATITAGDATDGKAELMIGSTVLASDTTIAVGDVAVSFDLGLTTNAALQAAVATGGVAKVRLHDKAGNYTDSTVNPTLTRDMVAPTLLSVVNSAATFTLNDVISFTFSEAMQTAPIDAIGNYTITSTAGTIKVDAGAAANQTGTIQVNVATFVNGDKITLGSAIVDTAGNPINASNDTVTFTNVTAANVVGNNTVGAN
jgi:hypothetical protein